jgi:hypothetical protein
MTDYAGVKQILKSPIIGQINHKESTVGGQSLYSN